MTTGVCPGSFDPFTFGHLDIVRQALVFCDRLVVAFATNSKKKSLLTPEQKRFCIEQTLAEAGLEQCCSIGEVNGLLVDFCHDNNIDVIVKGLRSGEDFQYELPMSQINLDLGGPTTVFVPTRGNLSHISSSMVRELVSYGAPVDTMVSSAIVGILKDALEVHSKHLT